MRPCVHVGENVARRQLMACAGVQHTRGRARRFPVRERTRTTDQGSSFAKNTARSAGLLKRFCPSRSHIEQQFDGSLDMRREARIVIAFPCSLSHACVLGGGGAIRSLPIRRALHVLWCAHRPTLICFPVQSAERPLKASGTIFRAQSRR